MALGSLLVLWSGDLRQMDRPFRDSGLIREKWDETHFANGSTYGEKTIERGISGTNEFYESPSGEKHEHEAARFSGDSDGSQQVGGRRARINELRQRLAYVFEENDRLQQELADERAKQEELEGRHEAAGTEERSLFSWW